MTTHQIALIGCGPWGLAVLERLLHHTRSASTKAVSYLIHVIEPSQPGVGVYPAHLPDHLILNTACGQINLFGHTFLDTQATHQPRAHNAASFFEWLQANDYHYHGRDGKRPVRPTDFLPRSYLGDYLAWVYQTLVSNLPDHICVTHHPCKATDIQQQGEKQIIYRGADKLLAVDRVIITIGHAQTINFEPAHARAEAKPPRLTLFPTQRLDETIAPDEPVFIMGMGLSAIDVISCLTAGRGGRFERTSAGNLTYIPGGKEPRILQASRSGLHYLARPVSVLDNAGSYQPIFLTRAFVDKIKSRRKVDFRFDILPRLWEEMKAVFYIRSAALAGKDVRPLFLSDGTAAFDALEACYGAFDPEKIVQGNLTTFPTPDAYQYHLIQQIKIDIEEAKKGEAASPVKSAIELIRVLRDLFRYIIDFDGLSEDTLVDFRHAILPRLYRAVVGPPVRRNEELLALIDAGILHHPVGHHPEITFDELNQHWCIRSTKLQQPQEVFVRHVIEGFISAPDLTNPRSPLLRNLLSSGRIRPYQIKPGSACGVDISPDFNAINAMKQEDPSLYILGLLTDGKRNFNLYLPSPRSRVRAFLDAETAVCTMIKSLDRV